MSTENGVAEAHQWDTARKRMGAVSELRASAHLLAQGYDVYRSVADRASFDLVAHRDGQLIRVEVKTLSRPKFEHYCPAFGWPVNDEWDLLLLVGPDVVLQFWADSGVTRLDAVRAVREHYGLKVTTEPTQRERVRALLEEHPDREWTASEAAEVLDLPRAHVTGAFKALDEAEAIVRVRHGVFRGSDRPGASEPVSPVVPSGEPVRVSDAQNGPGKRADSEALPPCLPLDYGQNRASVPGLPPCGCKTSCHHETCPDLPHQRECRRAGTVPA